MPWINPRDRYFSDDLCLYRDQITFSPHYEALKQDRVADVCIVGGGLTGVLTANYLVDMGYSVVLLERHRIGWGASGRNGGQLIPGFNKGPNTVADKFGLEESKQAYAATLASLDEIVARIKDNNIDCEYRPGYQMAAMSKRGLADLHDYAEFLDKNCNHKIDVLDKDATAKTMGTQAYGGSAVDMRSGRYNPLKYLTWMTDHVAKKGVSVHEESPAMSVLPQADGRVVVQSSLAKVTARKVVLAGDAYMGWLVPSLRRRYVITRTSMLATAPLPEDILAQVLPAKNAICEWRILLNYFCLTPDGRMVFGGGDSPLTSSEAERQRAFRYIQGKMIEIFPMLRDVHITHWWGGYLSVTMAEVPNVGKLDDNTYFANSYAGHGNVPTHMAAYCMAHSIHGDQRLMNIMDKFKAPMLPGAGSMDMQMARLGLIWYRIKDMFA